MSFAEDAEKESQAWNTRGCGVGKLLTQLSPKLRKEVEAVMKDRPDITSTAVRAALVKSAPGKGIPSAYTIQRHRRSVCTCEN